MKLKCIGSETKLNDVLIQNRIDELKKLEYDSSPQEWLQIQKGINELQWVLDEVLPEFE